MAKLVLILFCCFIWVGADPFFFNIQKSYVSQSAPSTSHPAASRPAASQSISLGSGGIFSKWLLFSQIFANKFTTQRPRPTQRPVVQIDPVYKPVDLDKEYASTPSTEVPAEEIETTKKSTTSTTSSYEYTKPSTTERTTTPFSFSESATEAETFKPTTYRPITTSTTQGSTTTSTTTTEKSEAEIGYEIDSSEQDKPNEIIEPSTTSTTTTTTTTTTATTTTTEEYTEGVETTEAPISLPLTYLPPFMKDRRFSATSVGLAGTASISSGVLSTNTDTGFRFSGAGEGTVSVDATSAGSASSSGNARPFDIVSFRGSIADDVTGEGVIEEARSAEVNDNGIDPRVFYYY